ncbi:MAG: type III pantothenate kinase [Gemmataceae bacterium]
MKPAVVVDVGNSRIKWGLCGPDAVRELCSLPSDDPTAWEKQRLQWGLGRECQWVVTGVHPARCARLADWLRQCGQQVLMLDDPGKLPLRVLVARPDHVGIDRLLDAVAANSRRSAGVPAAIIDAGSAVTVDLLDANGAFVGGAIVPGLRLMAKSLHDYTALLPIVEPPTQAPPLPGTATIPAVEAGIFWAVAGGTIALLREYRSLCRSDMEVFLTGGDGSRLQAVLPEAQLWPMMTLEGIRLSAEALP